MVNLEDVWILNWKLKFNETCLLRYEKEIAIGSSQKRTIWAWIKVLDEISANAKTSVIKGESKFGI